jgi:hypothetical protein
VRGLSSLTCLISDLAISAHAHPSWVVGHGPSPSPSPSFHKGVGATPRNRSHPATRAFTRGAIGSLPRQRGVAQDHRPLLRSTCLGSTVESASPIGRGLSS